MSAHLKNEYNVVPVLVPLIIDTMTTILLRSKLLLGAFLCLNLMRKKNTVEKAKDTYLSSRVDKLLAQYVASTPLPMPRPAIGRMVAKPLENAMRQVTTVVTWPQ